MQLRDRARRFSRVSDAPGAALSHSAVTMQLGDHVPRFSCAANAPDAALSPTAADALDAALPPSTATMQLSGHVRPSPVPPMFRTQHSPSQMIDRSV